MSKVIQIIRNNHRLYALRDDGSLWYMTDGVWYELDPPLDPSKHFKEESSVNCEPEKSRDISKTVSELIRKPYRS
jgi:hypothetical protein